MTDKPVQQSAPVNIVSFGFKYGLPDHCAMVFDVRMLRNPYWVDELRNFDGNDPQVKQYIFDDPNTLPLAEKITNLVSYSLPLYRPDPNRKMVIGIGCTGGRHRSVAVVNEIANRLRKDGSIVTVEHRDIGKDILSPNGEES